MSNIKPRTVPTKRLAESITSVTTSITLNSITEWDGVDLGTTSFNNSTCWPIVLRNETNNQYELCEIDTTTLSGNTYQLTKRALGYGGETVAGAETAYDWNAIETLVELGSNPPQLYEDYLDHTTNETVTGTWTITSTGQWTYNRFPTVDGTPVSSSDIVNKGYVDGLGISPTPYQAQIIAGNGSTSYSKGSVVYYSSSDYLWYPSDADNTTSFQYKTLGITQSTSNTSGDSINILLGGNSTSVSTAMTAGTKYYLGNTTGAIATTGTYEVYLGYALSSTNFLFQPRNDQIPWSNEKYALIGSAISTSAVPSSSNPYLTKYDTTSAVTTGCLIPLRNSTGDILVNETPQSSSAAIGRDYFLQNSPNTVVSTAQTWFTCEIPTPKSSSDNLWASSTGSLTYCGMNDMLTASTTGDQGLRCALLRGEAEGSYPQSFGANTFKIKFLLKAYSTGVNVGAFGLTTTTSESAFYTITSTASDCLKFHWSSSHALSVVTANNNAAGGVSSTSIASMVSSGLADFHLYEIDWSPATYAKFYIDGTLVCNSTATLPSTGTMNFMIGWNSNGANCGYAISPITLSYKY